MKLFVSATTAPPPRTQNVALIATFYAGLLTAMVVSQLFTFEEFLQHFVVLDLPGGRAVAHFVGAGIIFLEFLAIPFLLRMALSPAFRWVSLAAGWLTGVAWLALSVWTLLNAPEVSTIGFLGTVVDLTPGWWAPLLSVGFVILAAWSSWGMSPIGLAAKTSRK
ncbi:hypothetical protein CMN23_01250 [Candidatus Saccharibacteria bacterium]|nr:hypothetical protein [Candidatus Saccharibacteria bacterium]MBJ58225.1 hypothetical protein [Candidatus Saccharibacteria bacterium]|tara:strand:+ start:197 stop:688 length:492 start_codon:yes stop_codon:yes gene_type:complete